MDLTGTMLPPVIWDARVWPLGVALPTLAPGVQGLEVRWGGALWVPIIFVPPEMRGRGRAGAYVEGLPSDEPVIFPSVVHAGLARVLERHGFRHVPRLAWIAEHEEWLDGHVRGEVPWSTG